METQVNPHATEENNAGLNKVVSAVPDDWEQYDGLPSFSAEFKGGDFALAIQHPDDGERYEITLHHDDCPDNNGVGGWRSINHVRSTRVFGSDEAKAIVKDYIENREEYVQERLSEVDG